MNPENPTVLLLAPTGVAAINIDGTTTNTALAIPKNTGDTLPVIIDEISMVSNTALLHVHQRLKDIFVTSSSQLFAGLSVIAVADLYQLPPIQKKSVFEDYKYDALRVSP